MNEPKPVMGQQYDADYYLRGQQSGKSLYDNYRWLPDLTLPMAEVIAEHMMFELNDKILDFGCARGYLVKALNEVGYENATGCDLSDWALANCDEDVRGKVSKDGFNQVHDWVIAKDTLEHLTVEDLRGALLKFEGHARHGVFIVVPLAEDYANSKYVIPEYEQDITHVIRWPLWKWVQECLSVFGETWEISARYRLKGVKDNYSQFAKGNGFITIRRIT